MCEVFPLPEFCTIQQLYIAMPINGVSDSFLANACTYSYTCVNCSYAQSTVSYIPRHPIQLGSKHTDARLLHHPVSDHIH